MEKEIIEHCNTPEYWDTVWSKWRHDDKKSFIAATVQNVIKKEYWDEAFYGLRPHDKHSVNRAFWYANMYKPKSVLDIGSGNGRLLYGIKTILPESRFFGIDLSKIAIERMKNEYGIYGIADDIKNINIIQDEFDMVIVNDVLEHVEDDSWLIKKCSEKTKNGGLLYMTFLNGCMGNDETKEHLRNYNEDSVRSILNPLIPEYDIEKISIYLLCIAKITKKK